jgi:alkaline phosphatase
MGPTGAFFVYQTDDNRQNLLAREVAVDQMVVWNTGTHTATPVLVFAKGAPEATAPFGHVLHHTQLGQYTIEAIMKQ